VIVGRTNENYLRERTATLKLRANPEQRIPLEIEQDYDSMSRMMASLVFAAL
jgi:hypothetical protein